MWRPSDEIQADLESMTPERISAGLRDLAECMDSVVDEFELAPLDLDLLAPFGSQVPRETQRIFVKILADYRSFKPPLELAEKLYRMALVAVEHGDDQVALYAAMELKINKECTTAVGAVLDRLRERGLCSEREVSGAGHYLSYMLDGTPAVRAATLQALASWKAGLLPRAVDYIRPQLDEDELKQLA